LEKNLILLNAPELCRVLDPNDFFEEKSKILLLSLGDKIKCIGELVSLEVFLDLKASQSLLECELPSLVRVYFNELPVDNEL